MVFYVEFVLYFSLFWCAARETNPTVNNPELWLTEPGQEWPEMQNRRSFLAAGGR